MNSPRPISIVKRDGEAVPFDRSRIAAAIDRAFAAVGQEAPEMADELAHVVEEHLVRMQAGEHPDLETVQDAVILVLQESGHYEVALAYSRYRDARERARRQRSADGEQRQRPNLQVLGRDGRTRAWDAERTERFLRHHHSLSPKAAADVRAHVEGFLAGSDATRISAHLLQSLVDAALVRLGMAEAAERCSALRVDREQLRGVLDETDADAVATCGREVLRMHALAELLPPEAVRLYAHGRIWVDGLDDPHRGSHFTAALDGHDDPWRVVTEAWRMAAEFMGEWRRVTLVLPPVVIGHLERHDDADERTEAAALAHSVQGLARLAEIHLYCDGRTPLLDRWPFTGGRIGLASYAQDFLILRRLQEMGIELLSGPGLMQGSYRRRTVVSLALNAQGLEEQFSQLDGLVMGAVGAARARLQLLARPAFAGGAVRYAIYGLPPSSPSAAYLERQVVQEGLRQGIALARTSSLPEEACAHLGRLLDGEA
jgi:transcriptional regulator NrdR family protein